uniref:Unannotated protein n=1 Tax=freshwater metagenome TaxID=449393 RepID=A0A6J5YYB9_9ZZZZ
MAHYQPRFPRAVNGQNYRIPFDADPPVEAISSRMAAIYSDFELAPDDRARLLMLHRQLNAEASARFLARRFGGKRGDELLAPIRVRFIEFARRVGAVTPDKVEADDDAI